ncbi:MAG: site-2 protease family protein [Candidatus Hadarchaeia archaeon]
METSLKIGEISGIPIKLHFTLLIIIGYITWSIGNNLFQLAEILGLSPPSVSPGLESYFVGIIIAIGLFTSVLLHELAHSLTARNMGVQIKEISLWIFGGMASMNEIPRDPNSEIKVGLMGPLASLATGGVLFSISIISGATISFILSYLAFINILLAGFNLIPAFPMDGGRILRATLAKRDTYISATKKAANIGKIFAILMGVAGIFINPFLLIIAIFVYIGADRESQSTIIQEVLSDVKAKDIMAKEVKTVPPDWTLQKFMKNVLDTKHTGFPVVENNKMIGIITLGDVREIPQKEWEGLRVKNVMEKDVISFSPQSRASELWQKMASENVGRFPILSNDNPLGMVTRTDIIRAFRRLSEIRN